MKFDEPESMLEIRRIREKLLKETEGMSLDEQTINERKKVEEFIKKNGIKVRILTETPK